MRFFLKLALSVALLVCPVALLSAQELAPRAYLITPLHSNAITLTWSFYHGSANYNAVLPINGAKGTYSVPILSCYHSFGFFGQSGNVIASLPYAEGNFHGTVSGVPRNLYRSGLLDSVFRLSINLKGGPAMSSQEFVRWKQKSLIGASLKVMAPTGQYNPTTLINWGTNRWSFKPEIAYSRRSGKWVADEYLGVWFFTTNHDFWSHNSYFPGTRSQSQKPIGALEGHLSYDFKPRLWISLDGNFWFGGRGSVNDVENPLTEQTNSRLGGTAAIPITKHQSLKFAYSNGTYIRFGGNYQNLSVAWQYSGIGKPP